MRILIIDNSSVTSRAGKSYTNVLNGHFLTELISFGNKVSYFQFVTHSKNNINSFDLVGHAVNCCLIPRSNNKLISYFKAYLSVIKIIRAVDFVYLFYPNSFRYVFIACLFFKKKYGVYVRGMKGIDDKISHFLYRHAFAVFTVSDRFTKLVNSITKSSIATTIRPMITYTDFDILRGRIYHRSDCMTILFLGRIDKEKGLGELIQAAAQLKKLGCSFKLKIVGSGGFLQELANLINVLHLEECVFLEGPVLDDDQKAAYYKHSDIYILPTYHEGFPRTLYEAMIFGTPIITTLVGGISGLMKDGVNCKSIEPRSVKSIVNGLLYAINNYEDMGRMARNATDIVENLVDHRRPSHAYQLYEKIRYDVQ